MNPVGVVGTGSLAIRGLMAIAKPGTSAISILISAVVGVVAVLAGYALAAILLLIAAILAFLSRRERGNSLRIITRFSRYIASETIAYGVTQPTREKLGKILLCRACFKGTVRSSPFAALAGDPFLENPD